MVATMPIAAAVINSSNPDCVSMTPSPRPHQRARGATSGTAVRRRGGSRRAYDAPGGTQRGWTAPDHRGPHAAVRLARCATGYDGPGDHPDRRPRLPADRGAAAPPRRRPDARRRAGRAAGRGDRPDRRVPLGHQGAAGRARHPRAPVPGRARRARRRAAERLPRDRAAQPRVRHDRARSSRSRSSASLPILLSGTAEQQARWFPRLAAGEQLIAFALTEAEAGSDAAAVRTRAVRDGDDYVITGSKRFISQGSRGRPDHGLRGHRPGRAAPAGA